jgi:hypothetical protein
VAALLLLCLNPSTLCLISRYRRVPLALGRRKEGLFRRSNAVSSVDTLLDSSCSDTTFACMGWNNDTLAKVYTSSGSTGPWASFRMVSSRSPAARMYMAFCCGFLQ